MYKPNRKSFENFKQIKTKNYWEKTERIFQKYKKAWKGPDIPIYIFPIAAVNSIFQRRNFKKSGVAFKDKLFLFISPFEDEKELEALFVHEYHHTCRIHRQNKQLSEATLLDSMILEGLAEHTVADCCGKKYLADWCEYYSKKEILFFWEKFLKQKGSTKKLDKLHDEILYGNGRFPKMVGYAAGFVIVSIYRDEKDYSLKDSFDLPSERFISSDFA
ncbi:DUF2268 domain-containing protein [Cytobacillus depressus]|uniref:DUF2268 domain-containing protein n=2 Tax=Cytobacillus depressus TaxID=1602942 RepID=A0A6L3V8D7_9BACI|nr:DUF2268 domain-containing protein [Cytobacillus depressus]